MDTMFVKQVAQHMRQARVNKHCLVGFDGFIDEIINVVDKRYDPHTFDRIPTISAFSQRVALAAGKSANMELVTQSIRLGGNGPLMALALLNHGYNVSYIGALGTPDLDPLYSEFAQRCRRVISLTNPGYTQALEFEDGKLLLGKMCNLTQVSWPNLLEQLYEDELEQILGDSALVAFTNWTMLPGMNDMLENLGRLAEGKDLMFFIDLADPRKRTQADILGVLSLLGELPVKVILGLNESENELISQVLDIEQGLPILERTVQIREKTGVWAVVTHPVNGAYVAVKDGSYGMAGPYTPTPKLSTGAGDNFNAGFCAGLLWGLTPFQSIVTGFGTSGYYVRNAASPTQTQLADFIIDWATNKL